MIHEQEIEFKTLLTKKEYNFLKNKYFENIKINNQINYYFNSNKKERIRIRKDSEGIFLTIKIKNGKIINEYHFKKDNNFLNKILKDKYLIFNHPITKDKIKINYLGFLENKRMMINLLENKIFLDNSKYNKNEDYELEIETKNYSDGKKFFEKFCLDNNIEIKKSNSKIVRFIKTLDH